MRRSLCRRGESSKATPFRCTCSRHTALPRLGALHWEQPVTQGVCHVLHKSVQWCHDTLARFAQTCASCSARPPTLAMSLQNPTYPGEHMHTHPSGSPNSDLRRTTTTTQTTRMSTLAKGNHPAAPNQQKTCPSQHSAGTVGTVHTAQSTALTSCAALAALTHDLIRVQADARRRAGPPQPSQVTHSRRLAGTTRASPEQHDTARVGEKHTAKRLEAGDPTKPSMTTGWIPCTAAVHLDASRRRRAGASRRCGRVCGPSRPGGPPQGFPESCRTAE